MHYAGQLQTVEVHGKGFLERAAGSKAAGDGPTDRDHQHDHSHFQQYYVQLKSGELRQLSFPKTPSTVSG